MVAGHLQEKNGYFYAVLSYKDAQGKRKTKWIPTGYLIRGNKKKAEAFLMEQRQTFQLPAEDTEAVEKGELFADYLERWLKIAKSTIAITTYSSYDGMMKSTIVPWFRKTGVTITELTAQDIQDFYTAQLARVKSNTVIHYHALIHRALKYAVKTDLLSVNPADKVDRPRKNGFQPAFYDKDEINQLLACVKGTLIETPVMLAAFYGLRRSEAVGLRWDAIDFQQNTITIQHTVIACRLNGKYEVIARDTTKTKSSRRTHLLAPFPLCRPVIPFSVALLRCIPFALAKMQKFTSHLCAFSSENRMICRFGRRRTADFAATAIARTMKAISASMRWGIC
jgi:hypothetical protein